MTPQEKLELVERIKAKRAEYDSLVSELELLFWLQAQGVTPADIVGVAIFDNVGHGPQHVRRLGVNNEKSATRVKRILSFKIRNGSIVNFDRDTCPVSDSVIMKRKVKTDELQPITDELTRIKKDMQ